jgi:hypothetical protein
MTTEKAAKRHPQKQVAPTEIHGAAVKHQKTASRAHRVS